uniref:MYB transcription factor n=2 Tax=Amaryllidoideae TaxID=703251 RepID=R9YZ62_NARTA|nr:MYB transcription factor [Narcissus tazetta subsp. chinensis]
MDADGSSKKLRKPYTITKMRDRWSEEEHERFLDGLLLFGREWKKIEDFVGTKTVIQIRSHAQKYFLKVQKNGLMAHVPPPRPKRNHAYPYPQKSSEDDMLPLQVSSSCFIPPCISWDDKSMFIDYTSSNDSLSLDYSAALPGVEGDAGSGGAGIFNQNFGWTGSSSKSLMICDEQGSQQSPFQVIPNFAEVYNLIATIIDPEITNSFGIYMQKLKEMDPVTAKTVLVLMKNLTINLSSADFEPLRRQLLICDDNTKETGESSDAVANANQIYNMPSQCTGYLPM